MFSIRRNNIRKLRSLRNMTQPELAKAMQRVVGNTMDVSTISKHENGKRGIRREELMGYSLVFNIPSYALYQEIVSL